MEFIQDSFNF